MDKKFTMKKLLLILVLAVMCSSVARADDFDDGAKAYQKEDYATALKLWRPLATQGSAEAQYRYCQDNFPARPKRCIY